MERLSLQVADVAASHQVLEPSLRRTLGPSASHSTGARGTALLHPQGKTFCGIPTAAARARLS